MYQGWTQPVDYHVPVFALSVQFGPWCAQWRVDPGADKLVPDVGPGSGDGMEAGIPSVGVTVVGGHVVCRCGS